MASDPDIAYKYGLAHRMTQFYTDILRHIFWGEPLSQFPTNIYMGLYADYSDIDFYFSVYSRSSIEANYEGYERVWVGPDPYTWKVTDDGYITNDKPITFPKKTSDWLDPAWNEEYHITAVALFEEGEQQPFIGFGINRIQQIETGTNFVIEKGALKFGFDGAFGFINGDINGDWYDKDNFYPLFYKNAKLDPADQYVFRKILRGDNVDTNGIANQILAPTFRYRPWVYDRWRFTSSPESFEVAMDTNEKGDEDYKIVSVFDKPNYLEYINIGDIGFEIDYKKQKRDAGHDSKWVVTNPIVKNTTEIRLPEPDTPLGPADAQGMVSEHEDEEDETSRRARDFRIAASYVVFLVYEDIGSEEPSFLFGLPVEDVRIEVRGGDIVIPPGGAKFGISPQPSVVWKPNRLEAEAHGMGLDIHGGISVYTFSRLTLAL